ncbi:MAG: ArsA family ATPase [Methanomicrobium sp.]|nr:ArsA family ATPase [Methanomicrobium sp.]
MGLVGLKDDLLKLIFFGGKGGVGKTTCASGAGIYLSQNLKTLIISTDPAHSLSDSIGQKIGDEIEEIKGITNLSAIEINSKKALAVFKTKYEKEIKKILDTSTYLDQEDIKSVFTLPIPGIDEVMGLKTIVDMVEEGKFDKYIVDTAPTGHAIRLLTLPDLLDDWIKVMAKMRWKYRYMVETFAGKYKPDEGDDFLVEMKKTVNRIHSLFRDSKRCEFIVVTIPEDMAVSETEKFVNNLKEYGIKVRQIVMNNVMPVNENCEFCREKRKGQEGYINYVKEKMSNVRMTIMPLQPREVKGLKSVESFKALLFG